MSNSSKYDDKDLIKKLQVAQLNILLELNRVCEKLNLTYCLAFGTCLEAIRHKGFILMESLLSLPENLKRRYVIINTILMILGD